jgi:hypothetical protein
MSDSALLERGTLTEDALPHKHRIDGLDFSIESCELDFGEAPSVSDGRRFVSLEDETSWGRATLRCELTVPEQTLDTVFPDDESGEWPGRLIVAIWCRAAIGRAKRDIASSPLQPGTHEFNIPLQRDELRGDVGVQPFVVRDTTRSEVENYAVRTGMWVASSRPWTVRIDEPYEGGSLLRPLIEPFEEYPHFPDDQLHYLSLEEPASPQLFLNGDHELVVSVLSHDASTTGAQARLRDVLYDHITVSVWSQLLLRAIDDFDGETESFQYEWETNAFERFAEHLFEDTEDHEEALEELVYVKEERDDRASLNQRIERAVYASDVVDMPGGSQKLIEEVLNDD